MSTVTTSMRAAAARISHCRLLHRLGAGSEQTRRRCDPGHRVPSMTASIGSVRTSAATRGAARRCREPRRRRMSSLMSTACSTAMSETGPFVLLGASFGGLVAGAYAVAHPDMTAGVLLLDSSIPDDYAIDERHGFDGMCLEANRQSDASSSLEKIDNCQLAKWAYDRRDQEPDVPLTYLAAEDPSNRGDVADDPIRKAFVERWSPGVWETVSAPHWMDEADPDLVVEHLERVVARRTELWMHQQNRHSRVSDAVARDWRFLVRAGAPRFLVRRPGREARLGRSASVGLPSESRSR